MVQRRNVDCQSDSYLWPVFSVLSGETVDTVLAWKPVLSVDSVGAYI
jgi:hypothetical protein